MSHPAQCSVCDTALNPYGQDTRCARCNEDCPVCGKDVSLCHHKLDEHYRLVVEEDIRFTVEIMANAAPQHRVTRQSASPVSRSRPSGRVPTFASGASK